MPALCCLCAQMLRHTISITVRRVALAPYAARLGSGPDSPDQSEGLVMLSPGRSCGTCSTDAARASHCFSAAAVRHAAQLPPRPEMIDPSVAISDRVRQVPHDLLPVGLPSIACCLAGLAFLIHHIADLVQPTMLWWDAVP